MTQTPESATASQDSDRSQSAGTPTEVVSEASLQMQQQLVKAVTPAGAFMTDDHRYYFNGVGPVPGVTTVLEVMDKPALSVWKAQQAVRSVYGRLWSDFTNEDQAVQWALN